MPIMWVTVSACRTVLDKLLTLTPSEYWFSHSSVVRSRDFLPLGAKYQVSQILALTSSARTQSSCLVVRPGSITLKGSSGTVGIYAPPMLYWHGQGILPWGQDQYFSHSWNLLHYSTESQVASWVSGGALNIAPHYSPPWHLMTIESDQISDVLHVSVRCQYVVATDRVFAALLWGSAGAPGLAPVPERCCLEQSTFYRTLNFAASVPSTQGIQYINTTLKKLADYIHNHRETQWPVGRTAIGKQLGL
jgi:hypothetical protein